MTRSQKAPSAHSALALTIALLAGSLTACGGGSTDSAAMAAPAATTTTDDGATTASAPPSAAATAASASATADAVDAQIAQSSASPTFHMAPALIDEPSTVDVGGTNASARLAPHKFNVDASVADLDTRGLTPQILSQRLSRGGMASVQSAQSAAPETTRALTGAVYTPAQIRAAYGLPVLPAVGASISAATAATLGAGQTIYLIDAYHDATSLSDLNSFSTRFGLPTCTAAAVATTAAMPLARPPSACTLSVVYATSAATMTTAAPAYNASWAPESKLDVQWAHAIAPLARIVLIETVDSMTNNLLGGIGLANKMGPGVVSMSFGLADPGWAATEDSKFTTAGMTYLAATGDVGAAVDWPAVSPNVLAVGGTGMDWSGSGTRYEQAWVKGGGGVSAYEALPTWQAGVKAAGVALTKRGVADVSFNANPMTGQYVALTLPGAAALTWTAYGGTSISSPQWAGIIAVANAIRVSNAKATLGDIHSLIYKSIAPVPGTYASAFADVVDGNNGACAICSAGVGYDTSTGWGTPNVAALMPILTGVTSTQVATPVAAPTVPGGALVAHTGVAFSASLGVTSPANVTTSYAIAGAPAGLAVNTAGTLTWAAPVAGTWTITARATTSAGGTATGTYSLTVAARTAPLLTSSAALTATAGTPFTSALSATNPNASTLVFGISGGPSGLTVNAATGALAWAAPVAGAYSFLEAVRDSYGMISQRTGTLAVGAAAATSGPNHAPTLPSLSIVATHGKAMSVTLRGHDADNDAMTYAIVSGAPAGLALSSAGALTWAAPTVGTHAVNVMVRDVHGATGTATLTLIIS